MHNSTIDLPHRRSRAERLRHTSRRLLTGGLGAALCATLTIGAAAQANAAPGRHKPIREAAEVGITTAGGGYAGWAARRQQLLHPQSKTAQSVAPESATVTPMASSSSVLGIDVASYQGNVNWSSWWSKGKRFAYVKATEGTSYTNPYFSQQYTGSYNVGMIRGSYHFARPDGAAGSKQAKYFVNHGGGWSKDGKTLPGALDIEDNYAGGRCYGNTDAQNLAWVKSFAKEYKKLTGRYPVIYTNGPFWKDCVGNSTYFKSTSPLWLAYYSSKAPTTFPGGYTYYTFWQYSGSGTDLNRFSAGQSQLKKLATG